jgi:hypothetical protein
MDILKRLSNLERRVFGKASSEQFKKPQEKADDQPDEQAHDIEDVIISESTTQSTD